MKRYCSCGKKLKRKQAKYCSYSCNNKYRTFKFSKSRNKKISKTTMGEKNHNWKGDKVGYQALHRWVERHKPKSKLCECCGKAKPYDLANISGKYKRDIKDYEWLCRKCHMKKDGRNIKVLKNLKQFKNASTKESKN